MVLQVLNRYLIEMSRVIVRHGGMVDKFMGDSIMALFGAKSAGHDYARQAVACAVSMQIAMVEFNARHEEAGMPPVFMGIGINTGLVTAGRFGSQLYSVFTVVGDEVNLASRIEAVSLRGQVLVSDSTYERCRGYLAAEKPTTVYVKGKSLAIGIREVLGIPSLGLAVPRQELRRSPRIEAKLPFGFRRVENNVVAGAASRGTTLDIGYHGLLAEVPERLAPHAEVQINLPLPLVGHAATAIYARVVKATERDGRYLATFEFTSVSDADSAAVRRFVQMLA